MNFRFLRLWCWLLECLGVKVDPRQQAAIDYLRTENQILREKLEEQRVSGLSDSSQPAASGDDEDHVSDNQ